MSRHAPAHILPVDDNAIVRADLRVISEDADNDDARRRSLLLIESMVRAGYSEREITDAVMAARGA